MLDEIADINDEWEAKAGEIEAVQIGLEKTDITIDELALLWVPVA